ncbi:hypothetical protein JTE90_001199 [Oedothorax gibbosus]|uniref:Uncharacterized protein n=1 Tax=Oedothorax gibbosus TaxID=931172 RepID=A0AAV6UU85_9ARAC|nr:hypothetical protein JTE90_001199 [Oedothorax gibbosus]
MLHSASSTLHLFSTESVEEGIVQHLPLGTVPFNYAREGSSPYTRLNVHPTKGCNGFVQYFLNNKNA